MELVQHTESDAWLALSLATHLNLLPLSRQLSCITGYPWSRTLQACPFSSRPRLHYSWELTLIQIKRLEIPQRLQKLVPLKGCLRLQQEGAG